MPSITIDPKMFIHDPFIKCPECGKQSFGVLMINARSYVRRCRECWSDKSFKLPPVPKKVIYLDQFAISEMMKAINPAAKKTDKVDPFFRKLFEKLDRLNKLQLIVCPDSTNHFDESLVDLFYPALKQLYEQLAHNLSFYDPATIKRFQILPDFDRTIGIDHPPVDVDDVLVGTGDLDGWSSRFVISVSLRDQDPELPNLIRQDRQKSSDSLVKIFEHWQSESSKTFKDWYEEERSAFGPTIIQAYMQSLVDFNDLSTGQTPITFNSLNSLMSNISVLFSVMHRKLGEQGFSAEEELKKSIEYFKSESIKNIPYVQISSMLFAALAREASLGRKSPPSRGMMNDVETISCYLPYCDAIFIDNECRRLLTYGLSQTKLVYKSKVFSQDNKQQFLDYLDDIEKLVSKEHLELVKQVYGEKWIEPYLDMFKR